MRMMLLCGGCLLLGTALAFGCGSADEHPLGGPFGGDSTPPMPNKGSTPVAGDPGTGDPNAPNPTPTGTGTTPTPTGTGHDAGAPPGVDAGGNPPPPGVDAGSNPPPPVDASPPPPAAPTWSEVYAADFGPGTAGRCGDSGCHSSTLKGFRCTSASDCYSHFVSTGYVNGASSPLTTSQSCVWWFAGNGNMPTDNNSPAQADLDKITAWVAAGALNN